MPEHDEELRPQSEPSDEVATRPTTGGTWSGGSETGTRHPTDMTGAAAPGEHGIATGGAPQVGGLGGTGTGAGGLGTTSTGTGGTRNLTRHPRPIKPDLESGEVVAGQTLPDIETAPPSELREPIPPEDQGKPFGTPFLEQDNEE